MFLSCALARKTVCGTQRFFLLLGAESEDRLLLRDITREGPQMNVVCVCDVGKVPVNVWRINTCGHTLSGRCVLLFECVSVGQRK